MYCAVCLDGGVDRLDQCLGLLKFAIFNGLADAGQFLINDTAGTNIDMAHFRVAHLPVRQTYIFT